MIIYKYLKIFLLIIFFGLTNSSFSQTQRDSILKIVEQESDSIKKVNLLLEQSKKYVQVNPSMAVYYAQKAYALSFILKNDLQKSQALYLMGKTYFIHNIYIKALNYFNQSITLKNRYFKAKQKDSTFLVNLASCYYNAANVYMQIGFLDSAISYNKRSLLINQLLNDEEWTAYSYFNLAKNYLQQGKYSNTGLYLDSSIILFKVRTDKKGLSYCWNSYGNLYRLQGNYPRALDYYLKSKAINEANKDLAGLATANNNIAIVHKFQGEYPDALSNFKSSMQIRRKLEDIPGLAESYNNIGSTFFQMSKKQKNYLDSALNYYAQCISYSKQINNVKLIATAYYNIGGIYLSKDELDSSFIYLNRAKDIVFSSGNMQTYAQCLTSLGDLKNKQHQYNQAINYLDKARKVALQINDRELIRDLFFLRSEAYSSKKEYKKAFLQLIDYQKMADSLKNEENTKKITRLNIRYEFEKKQKELEFLRKQSELKAEAELKHQKLLRNIFLMGFGFVAILAFVIFQNFRRKQHDNQILRQQKSEIEAQRDEIQRKSDLISDQNNVLEKQKTEIEVQRDEIQEKQRSIMDSINYASRIQRAILPNQSNLQSFFDDSFIYFKPRDVVSGDFYWYRQFDERLILVAADCTGHGVPAAIMSMLGVALLNQIIGGNNDIKAHDILTQLRKKVISTLHQHGNESETKDGMDMSLLIFDKQTRKIEYAGAHNPLYLLRDNEIIVYKADKMPIGISFRRNYDFSMHEIDYQKGDICYIFSDGYVDQFGGEKNSKFLAKRFRNLLLSINKLPLQEQQKSLDDNFLKWKGENEQVDDILVVGIQI